MGTPQLTLTLTIKEAYALGYKLMQEHDLIAQGWHFDLSNGKRTIGECNHNKKTIVYSVHYLKEPLHSIKDTILHEIAHALVGQDHGHDYAWRAKCIEIGAKPERLANEITTAPKYNYMIACPNQEQGDCSWGPLYRYRMRRRNYGGKCPECGTEVEIYKLKH